MSKKVKNKELLCLPCNVLSCDDFCNCDDVCYDNENFASVFGLGTVAKKKRKRQCIEGNCTTTSIFNFKGEKDGIYCNKHKKDGMVDVFNKKCTQEGCKQQPTYGTEGEKATRCKTHKTPEMVDVKHSRCK
jgi:hypothetical protein